MRFFIGLHQPSDARHFRRCMVSAKRLATRKADFRVGEWMMDSGAFTEIKDHGRYRYPPDQYAAQIRRWVRCGQLVAAVSQDWMCEPFVLARTGLTVRQHQELTLARYVELRDLAGDAAYLMPVLQGYAPGEYVAHLRMYGTLLAKGAWVGVGSLCKRNADPDAIVGVLDGIQGERPDLRLHGFGVKLTALADRRVRTALWSADSLAWSYAARRQGRNQNDWREAASFADRIDGLAEQQPLFA